MNGDIARTGHVLALRFVSGELEGKVSLDRRRDVRIPTQKMSPAAVRQLLPPQTLSRLADLVAPAAAEELHHQDVLRLEDRVALELRTPVTVRLLKLQKVLASTLGTPLQAGRPVPVLGRACRLGGP